MLRCTARWLCWGTSRPVVLQRVVSSPQVVGNSTSTEVFLTQRVVLLPILHAASRTFYDLTLQTIDNLVSGRADAHQDVEANMEHVVVESAIFVEGVRSNDQEAIAQRAEWNRAASNPADAALLEQAAETYAAGNGAEFEDLTRSFCTEYKMRYPLPDGVVLEDFYFKPLLAARFGSILANPDLVLRAATIPQQLLVLANAAAPVGSTEWLLQSQVSAYRERLFVSESIRLLDAAKQRAFDYAEGDEEGAAAGEGGAAVPSSTNDSSADGSSSSVQGSRPRRALVQQVIGVWGHSHSNYMVSLFESDHGFKRQEMEAAADKSLPPLVLSPAAASKGEEEEGTLVPPQVAAVAGSLALHPVAYGWNPIGHGG